VKHELEFCRKQLEVVTCAANEVCLPVSVHAISCAATSTRVCINAQANARVETLEEDCKLLEVGIGADRDCALLAFLTLPFDAGAPRPA